MTPEVINASKEKMNALIKDGNTDQFLDEAIKMMNASASEVAEQKVMAMYNQLNGETDAQILAARGIHGLTTEETKFYNTLIQMAQGAMTNTTIALPVTVENRAFEEMKVGHELLNRINFVDSKGVTEWIISKNLDYAGGWGDLNDAVSTEAAAAFAKVSFSQFKLSVWIPVPITMIELGLTWLDQFAVQYLAEIIARKLEDAIINGTGQKMPVGMIKEVDVENQTVPAVTKSALSVNALDTQNVGLIAARLCNNGQREIDTIDMIVNPITYWTKVYPAVYYTDFDGQIKKTNLPLNIIQSTKVPEGKAVFGLCRRYFATVGFGKEGKIQYSDHYNFLADVRTYKARLVAYGTPMDNGSFIYADISGLRVAVVPTATLSI